MLFILKGGGGHSLEDNHGDLSVEILALFRMTPQERRGGSLWL